MENIFEPNDFFNFSDISLAHPTGIQGGAYFTKILMNNNPLYIETPKCLTKQGFIKNGKKEDEGSISISMDENYYDYIRKHQKI